MKPDSPDLTRDQPRNGDRHFWDRQLRARFGEDLRAMFEHTLEEPLPNRISLALGQMDRGGAKSGQASFFRSVMGSSRRPAP